MLGKQIKVLNIREKIKIVLKFKGVICNLVKKKKKNVMMECASMAMQWFNGWTQCLLYMPNCPLFLNKIKDIAIIR